jgi:hypothetical protein
MQIETVLTNAPITPSGNGEVPIQAGSGSIEILMLMIVFTRLILGQPSIPKQ